MCVHLLYSCAYSGLCENGTITSKVTLCLSSHKACSDDVKRVKLKLTLVAPSKNAMEARASKMNRRQVRLPNEMLTRVAPLLERVCESLPQKGCLLAFLRAPKLCLYNPSNYKTAED